MHGLETIIARNNIAAEKASSKRIIHETLLLVENNPIASPYLKVRIAEAITELARI